MAVEFTAAVFGRKIWINRLRVGWPCALCSSEEGHKTRRCRKPLTLRLEGSPSQSRISPSIQRILMSRVHCRVHSAHIRRTQPDFGTGFQVIFSICRGVPFSLDSGRVHTKGFKSPGRGNRARVSHFTERLETWPYVFFTEKAVCSEEKARWFFHKVPRLASRILAASVQGYLAHKKTSTPSLGPP